VKACHWGGGEVFTPPVAKNRREGGGRVFLMAPCGWRSTSTRPLAMPRRKISPALMWEGGWSLWATQRASRLGLSGADALKLCLTTLTIATPEGGHHPNPSSLPPPRLKTEPNTRRRPTPTRNEQPQRRRKRGATSQPPAKTTRLFWRQGLRDGPAPPIKAKRQRSRSRGASRRRLQALGPLVRVEWPPVPAAGVSPEGSKNGGSAVC
jgi:hypothetical protein